MSGPRLSIVVPTLGRPGALRRLLASLDAADQVERAVDRIVVVANGPWEPSLAGIEGLVGAVDVEVLHEPRPGKGRACNVALDHLGDVPTWFLDDDVVVAPAAVCAMHAAFGQHGRGNVYGGPLHVNQESPPPPWLVPMLPSSVTG